MPEPKADLTLVTKRGTGWVSVPHHRLDLEVRGIGYVQTSFGTDERKRSKALILLDPEETFSFPPKDAVVKAKKCKTSVIALTSR